MPNSTSVPPKLYSYSKRGCPRRDLNIRHINDLASTVQPDLQPNQIGSVVTENRPAPYSVGMGTKGGVLCEGVAARRADREGANATGVLKP
jgi:hypothetical protein